MRRSCARSRGSIRRADTLIAVRQLRAALIALAIIVGLIDGLPLPPRAEAKPWQRPLVDAIQPVQRALLVPFAWIARDLKFTQRWALFQAADAQRFRIEVAGRTADGAWRVVYRAGDAGAREDADLLEYRRVRGAYNPTNRPTGQYSAFVTWLAARIRAAHPELLAVRVRMQNVTIDHGTVRDEGTFAFTLVRP